MRAITNHQGSDANNALTIEADEKGPGGASHEYTLRADAGNGYQCTQKIVFQKGAIKEVGRNAPTTDEALVAIAIDRLRGFQSGPFSCRENALALTKLEEALHWMQARTRDRMDRGVEGVSKA